MPCVIAPRTLALLALLAALAGCTSERWIADRATTYNKALEMTGNQELLLNILRASRRRPEYFSYISQVHGGSGLSLPSASASLPFGTAHPGPGTVSATLGYVGTSSFDVGALDTDDFMRGTTSAVNVQTIAHYWGQGWSPELLWFLLVRKVELRRQDGAPPDPAHDLWPASGEWPTGTHRSGTDPRLVTFENYPGNDEDFLAFKAISRKLLDESFGLNPREVRYTVNVGIPIDARQLHDYRAQLMDPAQGLTVKRLPDGSYQLRRTLHGFAFSYPGACLTAVRSTGYATATEPDETLALDECGKPPQEITIYLRSPEGVEYYLGELVRAGLRKAMDGRPNIYTASICKRGNANTRETLLFDVRRLSNGERPPLEVDFEGERYGVPEEPLNDDEFRECDAQNTMHVLSFVSQLLSLQRSARDLPSTGVVHVVQ